MKFALVAALLAAAILGVLYHAIVTAAWTYYAASDFSPLEWSLDLFGSGTVLFWVVLHAHDVVVNVLFALPFAAAFLLFRGLSNWLCVLTAVAASLVGEYLGVDWSYFATAAKQPAAWIAWTMQLISLPLAFVAVRKIHRRVGGNQFPSKTQRRAAA